ncbi:relaxase/mobilization nuclease domain-containing protein [Gordonia polyisoprenivorans]|uniref:MobA/VirD2-like nuclease domain-containing protein n=1 Tax=Gordonia polyisoprenivorans TaxID=84595 RepID=A0A846WPB9_9ACTN|nr:hypothetical protein [Gordonia polyisoprenivorans]NKY03087.1 hypothetical protein [Gordonia polyisoprenivorans]
MSGDPSAAADTRNDHIHLAAVMVRQDTGRRFHPRNDFPAVRAVMREWEDRLALTRRLTPHGRDPTDEQQRTHCRRRTRPAA